MKIYSAENIRKWDAYTIEKEPISSIDLMERAAHACSKYILENEEFQKVDVFCGPGNNGGDGLAIARHLYEAGKTVRIWILKIGNDQSEDFKINFERLDEKIEVNLITEKDCTEEYCRDLLSKLYVDLIIDAVFGSGLNRPLEGWIARLVDLMGFAPAKTISIDIPSGMFAEHNLPDQMIANAQTTLTFQTPKLAFFFKENYEYTGEVVTLDIGLHPDFSAESIAEFIEAKDLKLRPRHEHDHKGDNGWLHCIAGFEDMGGAAILAAKAAMRTGCGYVGVTCDPLAFPAVLKQIPEALLSSSDEQTIPPKSKAIVIGPGLGTSDLAQSHLKNSLEASLPLVLDADALNLLSQNPELLNSLPEKTILTPHLKELERLIGSFDRSEK